MNPILYIVSLPIGNPKDLTLRAVEIIQSADLILGEEYQTTSKLLKRLQITKEILLLNEHTTPIEVEEIYQKVRNTTISCIFSDAGTPILEDPGLSLVQKCIQGGVRIRSAPGPSAVLAALVLSGFPATPFSFLGFLPRRTQERKSKMREYLKIRHTLILYETPYRYKKAFAELAEMIPKDKKVFLGVDITTEEEIQFHGTWGNLLPQLEKFPKGNPVLVIQNR
jgi:16S rRNA (cytidine1402-2'-O)-methyltransferase